MALDWNMYRRVGIQNICRVQPTDYNIFDSGCYYNSINDFWLNGTWPGTDERIYILGIRYGSLTVKRHML